MDISQLFAQRNNQQQPQIRWDDFPNQVKLHVLNLLDEKSLKNLSIASTSARLILQNTHGTHITILPRTFINYITAVSAAALWTFSDKYYDYMSDILLDQIYKLTKDKKIRSLEMMEIPEGCQLDKCLHFYGHLKHVNIHCCGVSLLFDLFSKCPNLTTFQYRTGTILSDRLNDELHDIVRFFIDTKSVEWKWKRNSDFLNKVDMRPVGPPTQLAHLKEVRLLFDETLDWANLIFILLKLPVLPSVTRFCFKFQPEKDIYIYWEYHLLVLSCLADFMLKIPNLEIFEYVSSFNVGNISFDWETDLMWRNVVFSGLIERFGSGQLKQVKYAMMAVTARVPEALILVKNMMNLAAASLQRLQQLDLHLGESKEHDIFSGFISNLPSRLAKVSITDFSRSVDEPSPLRPNVYKVFTLAYNRPQRLAMFDSITILSVNCTAAGIQRVSVTRMLEAMPHLRELEFKGPGEPTICYVDMEDRVANPGIFERLEKLSIRDVFTNLAYEKFQGQGTLNLPFLCRFKNLKQLNLETFFLENGIDVKDLLEVFNRLNKLNKVNVNPVLCNLNPQGIMALKAIGDLDEVSDFLFWKNVLIGRAYVFEMSSDQD